MFILLSLLSTLILGFIGVIPPLQFYVRLFVYVLLIVITALYGKFFFFFSPIYLRNEALANSS